MIALRYDSVRTESLSISSWIPLAPHQLVFPLCLVNNSTEMCIADLCVELMSYTAGLR